MLKRLVLMLVGTLLLAGILLSPLCLRPMLEQVLSWQWQQPVHIGSISLQPWRGRIVVEDVQLSDSKLSWRRIQLDIDASELLSHHLHIHRLRMASPQIHALYDGQRLRLPALPFHHAAKTTDATASAWQLTLDEVDIQYARVVLQDVNEHRLKLYAPWLHLQRQGNSYRLQGKWQLQGSWSAATLQHVKLTSECQAVLKLTPDWQLQQARVQLLLGEPAIKTDDVSFQAHQLRWVVSGPWQHGLPGRLTHRLSLQQPALRVRDQHITLAHLNWQGSTRYADTGDQLEADGRLVATTLAFSQANTLSLLMQSLRWHGATQLTISAHRLHADGVLSASEVQLTGAHALHAQSQHIDWQGQVDNQQAVQGKLTMTGVLVAQAEHQLTLDNAQWQGNIHKEADELWSLQASQVMKLSGLRFRQPSLDIQQLRWQGDWQLHHDKTTTQWRMPDANRISLTGLRMPGIGAVRTAQWQGTLHARWCAAGCSPQTTLQGALSLQHLQHHQHALTATLASARLQHRFTLHADALHLRASSVLQHLVLRQGQQEIQLAHTTLSHMNMRRSTGQRITRLSIPQLRWQDVHWRSGQKNHFSIQQVEGKKLQLRLGKQTSLHLASLHARDLHGKLYLIAARSNASSPAEQQAAATTTPTKSLPNKVFRWHVGSLLADGDNQLELVDATVSPSVHWQWHELRLNSDGWGNDQHQQHTLQLEGRISPSANFKLKASLSGYAGSALPDIRGTLNIAHLDAASLSPYVEKISGYALQRGTIHATLEGSLRRQQLDSRLKLNMEQLRLIPGDPNAFDALQSLLGFSPDAALDTLRDSDDRIALDIPIVGDISQPDFQLDDVIRQAMAGSLQKAALTYVQYAFQPYGAVLGAAMWIGKQLHAVRLPRLPFAAGSISSSDARHNDILQKAAALLNDKPGTSLAVCGIATAADAISQHTDDKTHSPVDLRTLAKQRAEFIIRRLQQEWQIAPERLQRCRPEVRSQGEGAVQLLL